MLELVYGFYNETEQKLVYELEDIDDARADAIHIDQYHQYDFVILYEIIDGEINIIYESE